MNDTLEHQLESDPALLTVPLPAPEGDLLPQHQLGPWLQTYTGRPFHPLHPEALQVVTLDIAHGLSNICRFGGHSGRVYSGAQHSVLVSLIVPHELALV